MHISKGKCEIKAMVCYSHSIALMGLIAQMHYTSTPPWNIRYVWSLRVPPGPGTTSDGSLLVLGLGVTHHPWSYGQAGTLSSGGIYIYIYIYPMKNESESNFIIYSLFNIRCCVFSYITHLLYCRIWTMSDMYGCLLVLGPRVTGHSWS